MLVFTLHDSAADTWHFLLKAATPAEAKRMMGVMIANDPTSIYAQYPHQFRILEIGSITPDFTKLIGLDVPVNHGTLENI